MDKAFHDAIATGYALTEPGIVIGSAMLGDELVNDARVQVALSMFNRHGLIAGATGTGKTRRCSSSPASCRRRASRSSWPISRVT